LHFLLLDGSKKIIIGEQAIRGNLFHFIIFFSASAIQLKFALGGLFVFGWGVSAVLIYAILRGKNNILYEAIAREKDEPKQTYFIIIPYFATLFGGLASNYFFPSNMCHGRLFSNWIG
jgi:hypothetical protein